MVYLAEKKAKLVPWELHLQARRVMACTSSLTILSHHMLNCLLLLILDDVIIFYNMIKEE